MPRPLGFEICLLGVPGEVSSSRPVRRRAQPLGPAWPVVSAVGSSTSKAAGYHCVAGGSPALQGPQRAVPALGEACVTARRAAWETVRPHPPLLPDLRPTRPHLACLPAKLGQREQGAWRPDELSRQGLASPRRQGLGPPSPPGQRRNLAWRRGPEWPRPPGPFWGGDGSLSPEPPVVPFVLAGAWLRPGIQRDWLRWGRQAALEE